MNASNQVNEPFQNVSDISSNKKIHFALGKSSLDFQLAAVLVLRSIAVATDASLHLIESGLVLTLLSLLRTQQEDDEFVLQVRFPIRVLKIKRPF